MTGAGLVTALGRDVASTWSALRSVGSPGDANREASAWDPFRDDDEQNGLAEPDALHADAGEKRPSRAEAAIGENLRDIALLRREVDLLRRAWREALLSAGFAVGLPAGGPRVAVLLGSTLHGMRNGGRFLRTGNVDHLRAFLAGATLSRANPMAVTVGLCATTCSACSSGLASVSLACSLLQAGEADIVIAGGYDPISEYARAGFQSMRLVSPTSVRPFAADRDGMRVSEGFGVVVLERAADAEARGRRDLVGVAPAGESCDSFHLSKPHPEGEGAASAIGQALERAGIRAADLRFVVAHATGTRDNDAAEYAALSRVFGDRLAEIPVVCFKGILGHALGGAGAVELILAARGLKEGAVPLKRAGADYDIDFANLRLASGGDRETGGDHALVTSLGFGGANVSIVLSRPGATDAAVREGNDAEAFDVNPKAASRAAQRRSTPSAGRLVAVTGIGVVLPGAVGRLSLTSGDESVRSGRVPDDLTTADYEHLLNARRTRRMSEYARLCLAATADALSDVGDESLAEFLESCPVMVGTTHGATRFCEEFYGGLVKDGTANPLLFAEGVPNIGSAHLSTTFGVRAFCQSIIGARTAGLAALHLAATRIRAGEIDRAIVCAAEETSPLTNDARRTLSSSRAGRSKTNGSSSEYGSDGMGHLPGRSGAVALVLESEGDASVSGRRVRGQIEDGVFSFGASAAGGFAARVDGVREAVAQSGAVSISGPARLLRAASRRLRSGSCAALEVDANSAARFGDVYSVAPLLAIAEGLLQGSAGRAASVCVDDDGAIGVVRFTASGGS